MDEAQQSVYDLQDDDGAADNFCEDSGIAHADHHTTQQVCDSSALQAQQRPDALAQGADAECGLMFAHSLDVAPTVYDVMDSPLVAKRSIGTTLRGASDAGREDTPAGTMLIDLCEESPPVAASAHMITPTLARVGQNPFKATPPVQPTATVKKPRNPATGGSENASGSIHHAFSVSAQVHRKTLGAAPFVPIQPPPLDESIAAARRAGTEPVSSENRSGAKRKAGGTFALVQVPRKKLPNVQSSGSIMVASIKSFFSAV
jgi:hypothetical protein